MLNDLLCVSRDLPVLFPARPVGPSHRLRSSSSPRPANPSGSWVTTKSGDGGGHRLCSSPSFSGRPISRKQCRFSVQRVPERLTLNRHSGMGVVP